MKRFFTAFLNPYFLSLWMTILVLLIVPLHFRKYTAERIENGGPGPQQVRDTGGKAE